MPEVKRELIGPGFKAHSVTGNNPRIIKAVAVMSIVSPAPLGALAIKVVGERVLEPGTLGC